MPKNLSTIFRNFYKKSLQLITYQICNIQKTSPPLPCASLVTLFICYRWTMYCTCNPLGPKYHDNVQFVPVHKNYYFLPQWGALWSYLFVWLFSTSPLYQHCELKSPKIKQMLQWTPGPHMQVELLDLTPFAHKAGLRGPYLGLSLDG